MYGEVRPIPYAFLVACSTRSLRQLSVPRPASFPRGSPVPFIITLRSNEKSAVAKLSEPSALGVYLRRQYVRAKRSGGKEEKNKPVTKGSYWVVADKGDSCTLQGEFPAMLQLGPSFTYRSLSLLVCSSVAGRTQLTQTQYSVTVEPEAYNFETKIKGPLASLPVSIAYFSAPGVRPRSFAPLAGVSANGAPRTNAPPMAMPSLISVA